MHSIDCIKWGGENGFFQTDFTECPCPHMFLSLSVSSGWQFLWSIGLTESALHCRFDQVILRRLAEGIRRGMRRSDWWKRFIFGSHLITCAQSSSSVLSLSSADAPSHFLFLFFISPLLSLISFQSVPPAFCDGAKIKYWAAPSL